MNGDVIIVTGSGGLIGSQAVRFFSDLGAKVVGIDNDMRSYFFGESASTGLVSSELSDSYKSFTQFDVDIRDHDSVATVFERFGTTIRAVIHCAAQPSHDWAAREPMVDFDVNARATLNLLECVRKHADNSVFVFTSTNKVYGDRPNREDYNETPTRWSPINAELRSNGFDENLSVDQCLHSLFGSSKLSGDVMVQEYGKYFGIKTGIFRGGCLTGPHHSGAELHGFLSYLVKCCVKGKPYTIYGYKGKQVRDNIHSEDLLAAFWEFIQAPRVGEVYNIGGGIRSNCSILEAIESIEKICGKSLSYSVSGESRVGDHIWYISDVSKFRNHYPNWKCKHSLQDMLIQMVEHEKDCRR